MVGRNHQVAESTRQYQQLEKRILPAAFIPGTGDSLDSLKIFTADDRKVVGGRSPCNSLRELVRVNPITKQQQETEDDCDPVTHGSTPSTELPGSTEK